MIALQLGHRRSIDFDLFSFVAFDTSEIKLKFENSFKIDLVEIERVNELTFHSNDVKFTFFHFSYPFDVSENFNSYINLPDLLTLSALKAFALGRRAKWKDYVDLYFLLKKLGIEQVESTAEKIFKDHFNKKLFRQQLCYFEDINYSETIDFMPGFEVADDVVRDGLGELPVS